MPHIFVQDVTKPTLNPNRLLDAIVCDPPYGIRHRSQKGQNQPKSGEFDVHVIYQSLLELGAQHLKSGGRLVFLFHTDRSRPAESNLFPTHEAF